MGVSTDAILFYGYCWDEEADLMDRIREGDDNSSGWAEVILRRRGEHDPWDGYPAGEGLPYAEKRAMQTAWIEDNRPSIDAWGEARKAVEREHPVSLGHHCSGECSMPYLAAFSLCASRGYPKAVELPPVDPAWREALDAWLALFGIEKPQPEPKWWLVSFWG